MEGEGEGIITTTTATASAATATLSPPQDPDVLPAGSLEDPVFQLEAVPCHPSETAPLTGDLRDKIIKQVEYYFSDENLPTDKYMMGFVKKDKEGFVPIGVIASFRKMKKLVRDSSLIVVALRESSLLVVSSDGKKVKRLHPLPFTEIKDPKLCTVLVENLPEDHSRENIWRIFGKVGNIKNICIRNPQAIDESTKGGKMEKLISNKIHALVEYETVEAAEKAVATLNDEQDWRNGMRVKLLKRMGKHGLRRKGWRDHDSDKNTDVQSSGPARDEKDHNFSDETPEEGDGEHSKEKNEQKGQNQGRSRRQKYRGMNGQGHGGISSSHVEASKPPPGPKMPDGTRGFTMGRGRLPALQFLARGESY
ncbi:la-related protein 6A [Malania oleifera]|uniref:la-related protein 6A n=1 Tax=Malania oleifera TaxID=397392 RepID=UPI0025AE12F4|nr:la-related protein 6A [Malania oleifera]